MEPKGAVPMNTLDLRLAVCLLTCARVRPRMSRFAGGVSAMCCV